MKNDHMIANVSVFSRSEDSVDFEVLVSSESDFFDGHFPDFKLLPAVGQFEVVSRFAGEFFGVGRSVPSIKRMKFSAPVLPDSRVRIKLDYNRQKNSIAFRLMSAEDESRVFSSGTFVVTEK